MITRLVKNGYTATFSFPESTLERPTFRFNDGPEYVAFSESHAHSVMRGLMSKGFHDVSQEATDRVSLTGDPQLSVV